MGGWSGASWCHTRKETEYNDSGLDAVWEELQAKTMRKCWDFQRRMRKVPEAIHYNAFFNVYDKLLPTLAHTMWPAGQEFDFVKKKMPRLRGANGMFEQYRELMRRVRRAAKSGWLSQSWHQMEKVMVQSVMTYGKLNATLGRMSPWKCVSVVACHCIFVLIGHMAGVLAPVGGLGSCTWRLRDTRRELVLDDDGRPGFLAGPPFKVAIGSLASIGCGSLLRTARTNRHKHVFRGSIGSFASLAFAPLQGKVVRVISADFVLAEGAIAASLMSNPFSLVRGGVVPIVGTQYEYSCDLG